MIVLAHTLPIVAVSGGASASAGKAFFSGKAAGTRPGDARFGSLLKKTTAASADPDDLLAQIATMLQNGTPMQTILDAVAAKLQTSDPSKRIAIVRSAHAPPGDAPPRTPAARQVAALARTVRKVPDDATRGMGTVTTRQQNDISGKILDATAKEHPASTVTAPQTTPVDLGPLAQTIIETVAASLRSGPTVPASVPQTPSVPQKTAPGGSTARPDTARPAPAPAPDLLTRMLSRAANASARVAGIPGNRLAPALSGGDPFAQVIANALAPGKQTAHTKTLLDPDGDGPVIAPLPVPVRDASAQPQAAQAAPAPYATVDPEAILSQIVKGIAVAATADGAHSVDLHLQPEQLGDVSLKLNVNGNSVSASVVAQNGDVRAALLNNQHHLSRAFSDAGLKLASFSVDVSGGDARGFRQDQSSQSAGRRYAVHGTSGAIDADATAVADGPTPIAASGPLELLNHLA